MDMDGNDKYESVACCPFCGGTGFRRLFETRNWETGDSRLFNLSECSSCRLVLQEPRVKEKYIAEFYIPELGYYRPPAKMSADLRAKDRLKDWARRQTLIEHFGYKHLGRRNPFLWFLTLPLGRPIRNGLMPEFVRNGTALDIGCAHGGRLEKLRQFGWKVEGVEMDSASVEYARNARKLPVRQATIERADFPLHKFDSIIMGMVLEHLYDPIVKLRRVTSWLKPGGELLLSIPYFRGFEFKIFGKYTHDLHLPMHITFFNARHIRSILSAIGYEQIKIHWHADDRNLTASAENAYSDTKKRFYLLLARGRLVRWFLLKPFVFLLSVLRRSGRVTVIARKSLSVV